MLDESRFSSMFGEATAERLVARPESARF